MLPLIESVACANVWYSNAAEICFVVIAVASRKLDIAKTALFGSILANSLLTFGACLMVGGLQQKTLTYPGAMIRINAQLLMVNIFIVVVPTAFKLFSDGEYMVDITLIVSNGCRKQ